MKAGNSSREPRQDRGRATAERLPALSRFIDADSDHEFVRQARDHRRQCRDLIVEILLAHRYLAMPVTPAAD
jgi:hypothetical protein